MFRANESSAPSSHNRFNVIGCSGSGKSTFARELAKRIEANYVELDAVYWKPNWTEPEDEELFRELDKALASEKWVLDGNYHRTIPIKWARVQTVIWLDIPFPTTLFQAFKRAIKRIWTKEEMWPGTGNRESISKTFFSRESILLWTITSYGPLRKRYLKTIQDPRYSSIHFVQLRSRAEAEIFLNQFQKK